MEARRRNNRRSDVFLLLIFSFSANLLTPLGAMSPSAVCGGQKVQLALYYEALCPYSEKFIVEHLNKLFDNELISIVDLKLSPYGNAEIRSNGTIVCQHGPWECLLNTVEACAIHFWPAANDHFPFVYCVEELSSKRKYADWETCFEKSNLDPEPVRYCYNSELGDKIEWRHADEMMALQPPHEFVPWVVVNGQPLYDDYPNYTSYICNAYKCSNVPKACRDLTHTISTRKHNARPNNPVSYREKENKKSILSRVFLAATSWMRQLGIAM